MEQAVALDLTKARRMAKRRRTEAACLPCRVNKSKCNDYRPCARCRGRNFFACTDTAAGCNNDVAGWGAAASRSRIVDPAVAASASMLYAQPFVAMSGGHWQVAPCFHCLPLFFLIARIL